MMKRRLGLFMKAALALRFIDASHKSANLTIRFGRLRFPPVFAISADGAREDKEFGGLLMPVITDIDAAIAA